jgi:hypothetical protein
MEKYHSKMKWKMLNGFMKGGFARVISCINSYAIKWLLHWNLNETHGFCMEVGRSLCPIQLWGSM